MSGVWFYVCDECAAASPTLGTSTRTTRTGSVPIARVRRYRSLTTRIRPQRTLCTRLTVIVRERES